MNVHGEASARSAKFKPSFNAMPGDQRRGAEATHLPKRVHKLFSAAACAVG
jgi:hypothetical protein